MKPNYVKALTGKLKSPPGERKEWDLEIWLDWGEKGDDIKRFPINSFYVYWISDTGQKILLKEWFATSSKDSPVTIKGLKIPSGSYILITTKAGAFITVFEVDPEKTNKYRLSYDMLCTPNDIGPIPESTKEVPIPQDTLPVVVAAGFINGNFILRTQFWQKMPDSYTLAPGESRTVGITISTGKSETSSSIDVVSESISASASAGWGPLSTSISASMSRSHTAANSYTVTEQRTSYETNTLVNENAYPVMIIRWQICDTLLVSSIFEMPLASIISYLDPCMVKWYNLDKLAKDNTETELSGLAASMLLEYPHKEKEEGNKERLKQNVSKKSPAKRVIK